MNEEFSEKVGMLEESVDDRRVRRGHRRRVILTFDFVAGLHAYDHGGPSRCVLSKDYFLLTICFVLLFRSFFIYLYKATQARRTTKTTEREQLAPIRTTTKQNWNKAAPF